MKECPFCEGCAQVERNSNIFHGQNYSDRYPPDVAKQEHGFRVRCVKCGCQTCWWHFKHEAIATWNKRHLSHTSGIKSAYLSILQRVRTARR